MGVRACPAVAATSVRGIASRKMKNAKIATSPRVNAGGFSHTILQVWLLCSPAHPCVCCGVVACRRVLREQRLVAAGRRTYESWRPAAARWWTDIIRGAGACVVVRAVSVRHVA